MRFTTTADLPESEYIADLRDVEEFCEDLEAGTDPIGFDTETSGLDQDGLGVDVYVVPLANSYRRAAVVLTPENVKRVATFLDRTQERHCGFNIIYDWNALYGFTKYKLGWGRPIDLQTCYADGLTLWRLFDEEGEETDGDRGLKARARQHLGIPMNDIDKLLARGSIMKSFEEDFDATLDYCTRDAWAHLGICLLGKEIAEQFPWGHKCPHCGFHGFQMEGDRFWCPEHGWVEVSAPGAHKTNMWDWHQVKDIPFLKTLQRMQTRGIAIDWKYLSDSTGPLKEYLRGLEKKFVSEVTEAMVETGIPPREVNINSPAQVERLYYGRYQSGELVGFGYPVQTRTDSGSASTTADAMQKLVVRHQAPGVMSYLKYKEGSKILSTYLEGLLTQRFERTGRLHGAWRPTTTTGRLRSFSPNMQNLPAGGISVSLPPDMEPPPKELLIDEWGLCIEEAEVELAKPMYQGQEINVVIRGAFVASDGFLLACADYAQLELRLAAIESGCEKMIGAINSGQDLHCYAAAQAFAAGLGSLTYDDLYEVKQWSDRDVEPRLSKIRSWYQNDSLDLRLVEETLKDRVISGTADLNQAVQEVLRCLPVSSGELEHVLTDTDRIAPALGALGRRDKELKALRSSAKSAIFGIIYGIGPMRLAYQITEATGKPCEMSEAKELIYNINHVVFDGLGRMIARLQKTVREYGYVRTMMGRYRHPAGVHSGDKGKVAQALRQSQNTPIQGGAADIVQTVMMGIEQDKIMREMGGIILNQVHDEILLEAPEDVAQEALKRMQFLMENAHGLSTPVPLATSGNVGRTWDEAK